MPKFSVKNLKTNDPYCIQLDNLGDGIHEFDFSLNDTFISGLSNGEIQHADVRVKTLLTKSNDIYTISISLEGKIEVPCDRCLELVSLPVVYHEEMPVRTAISEEEYSSDEVLIIPGYNEIWLSRWFAEFIEVSLPLQRVHPNKRGGKSGCNPEMIDRLRSLSHADSKQQDPRWDKLKELTN